MFCPSCGAENASDARFCGGCGASINGVNAGSGINTGAEATATDQGMSFGKSISTCLSKYGVWQGRASRSEYWWFFLFLTLLGWAVNIVDAVAMDGSQVGPVIVNLAFLLPSIAALIRRLHDTNRSGWWSLIAFTGIGIPVLIYWLASRGDEGQNTYG
jgi:uncharacterized membrane protein YhaH (DUF805 family)